MRGFYERSEIVRQREEAAAAAVEHDRATQAERYKLGADGQPALHIFAERGEWAVWLNTGVADFDGSCIGTGSSRQAAVEDAAGVLEKALEVLQGPPPLALVGR